MPANLYLYSRANIVILKPNYADPDHLKYPINHLRNLAISVSTSSHILVIDADFVPSLNLYEHARTSILPTLPEKTAVVVPCFAIRESHGDDPLPATPSELARLVKQGIAYVTDPNAGHGPTLGVPLSLSAAGATMLYEVCYESQWEPYYIVSRDAAPLYDVRFLNQGGDKQSHALQLNALGFRFLVSAEVFMLHKDHSKLQWPGGGFSASQKEAEKTNEWSYFDGFMREMEALYGRYVRWPRGCSANAIGWQAQQRSYLGIAAGVA